MGTYGVAPKNEIQTREWFAAHIAVFGYDIIGSGVSYPDLLLRNCSGEQVRAEVEYDSQNFLEHGHPVCNCDLVICWIHTAPLPLRVLELSKRRFYRPHSRPGRLRKEARLYMPGNSRSWWIRFSATPEEIAHMKPLRLPGRPNLKPSATNRVSFSLKTPYKRFANRFARFVARELERARKELARNTALKAIEAAKQQRAAERVKRKGAVELVGKVIQVLRDGLSCDTWPVNAKLEESVSPHRVNARGEGQHATHIFLADVPRRSFLEGEAIHFRAYRDGTWDYRDLAGTPRTIERWVYCGEPVRDSAVPSDPHPVTLKGE